MQLQPAAIGCAACDAERGILCLSCYTHAEDARLPAAYADYFSWAAGYPRRVRSRRPISLRLLAFTTIAATVLAYIQIAPVRAELDGLRARAAVIRDPLTQLREARQCSDQPFPGHLGLALERAGRGEQVAECAAISR